MELVSCLKKTLTKTPFSIGAGLAKIPYSIRPGFGKDYRRAQATRRWFEEEASPEEKRDFIFQRVRRVAEIAAREVPFYRDFYAENGFDVAELRSFEDLGKIPIVTKALLQEYELEKRSRKIAGRSATFTGGSSGEPFLFYSDKRQIGNEWAHMHWIWGRLGFGQADLKLSVALEPEAPPIFYNGLRHEVVLNIYFSREILSAAFLNLPKRVRKIKYLRGYPSAFSEFLSFCETENPAVLDALRENLRGTFLASEFPSPIFRETIERTTGKPTISWYGHAERAILAPERRRAGLYEPFQSYGFCETVRDADGFESLVGTAYWNFASPLIRYRVDDGVKVIEKEDGILKSFEILEGRIGDFLVDKNGEKFSITHLNLSCRRETWELVRCVQVEQRSPGAAIFWVTPRRETTSEELEKAFDFQNLALDCEFRVVEKPFRTKIGKTPLKISTQ
ncbi:MAG: hypothetical protein IJE77_11160 [Thermoguttaceae bacterium]|nr:hypothetical protein [Thermoguttaceae bacterium]MBQ9798522.1 hypothetical protein [Thermoguttaceae bacterium]